MLKRKYSDHQFQIWFINIHYMAIMMMNNWIKLTQKSDSDLFNLIKK